ncbi:hypothetical protein TWF173_003553 [Orbilia oligospora]|uniref:D-xylose 1-dehydrogenase (NADP(+), D-xylono-1,5-lactone-forming) n=2 Tax=Orbilia oligospora TaxID=2813651 RepID=G1X5Y7_ARTOA|nr:hypothetical protein AOL_s00054g281 [Orbilia oligospora ATCC 24927]EGX51582.1 hypothetical protein AOL_s00054g281 [Orbilia oligospora ATCC 24927]KAF3274731.1 hypothetical protein TWF970_007714 [Orbilia oligospora]KAF3319100.1 hypothetical protein TWF173_003553 [Orbilia oligospora]
MAQELPTVRWGIVATGMISNWFVSDLLLPSWPNKRANHIIQSIGSSSIAKGQKFYDEYVHPNLSNNSGITPKIYASYAEVYNDPDVDVVYIGTPHSFHKQNCIDAINAGKNVLCEKAFTLTQADAKEVTALAREKGVFLMEAMWTRFYPLVKELRRLLYEEKVIGQVWRTFADFGLSYDVASLPDSSRLKDLSMGAGSLLDIGIYSLTWGLLTLEENVGKGEHPKVLAAQTLQGGVETLSSWILSYPSTGKHGILTSTTNVRTEKTFARVEGSKGFITVQGPTSSPESFIVKLHDEEGEGKLYEFEKPGRGFYWEADAVAVDVANGRKENETIPLAETERVMGILDEIRKQGGARFPSDTF